MATRIKIPESEWMQIIVVPPGDTFWLIIEVPSEYMDEYEKKTPKTFIFVTPWKEKTYKVEIP